MTDPRGPHGGAEGGVVRSFRMADLGAILTGLAIGTIGGVVFAWLRLPLPWMMGAMVGTTAAAIAGVRIVLPQPVRTGMIAVLGVMLGAAFTPQILDRIADWPVTMAGLAVYCILGGGVVLYYFRRVGGYDPVTAYFAASPGGLNEMLIVGKAMGGDERIIALTHSARILLTVMIIPFWFRFFYDYEPPAALLPRGGTFDMPAIDLALLGGCAVLGPFVARLLRLPAAFLVGPMALSAAIHLTGVTHQSPPGLLVAMAQIVIGTGVGSRFSGVTLRRVLEIVRVSLGSTAILLGTAVLAAEALHLATGFPVSIILLAFAPGGLAEMSLVALAMGSDVAFVSTHHVVRIAIIVVLAPLAFRVARRWMQRGSPAPHAADDD